MKLIRKIKYPLTIIILIIFIIALVLIKKKLNDNKYNTVTNNDIIIEKEEPIIEEEKEEKCNIDIKGAIKKPGVYTINCDNNINDAIKLAGGLENNADTSIINLAKKVTNEMVIIVYTKEEVKNSNIVDTVIKVVEKECVCPNIQNDGCINEKITDTITNNNQSDQGLININSATKEQLLKIPGIGEAKAKAIINYREKNGNFKTIEDIQNVEGIGSKLYEEIKIYITT